MVLAKEALKSPTDFWNSQVPEAQSLDACLKEAN